MKVISYSYLALQNKEKKYNWPIMDTHNRMTYQEYKCRNKTFEYQSYFTSP